MARKLIKPLTLSEIQSRYGRPEDITRMPYTDLYTYYTKIARTANTRLASLEKFADRTKLTMYTADEFIERMQTKKRGGEANITFANRLRIPKEGERTRSELIRMIKTTEEFLRNKQSTVTGVRERYAEQVKFMSDRFGVDLTDAEAGALVEAGIRGGVSSDGWYEIIKAISEPAAQGVAEEDFDDLIKYIDTHIAMVDDSLEEQIKKIYDKYNQTK